MKLSLRVSLAVALFGAVLAARARADDARAPAFGAKGEVVMMGSSGVSISSTSFDGSQASSFSVSANPSLDYFVARNVSLGLGASVGYGDSKGYGADGSLVDTKTTSASIGGTLGYNVPLGSAFSLWPRVTLGFDGSREVESLVSGSSLSTAGSALGYPTTTRLGPNVDVYLPLLLHPAPHFFAGLGPFFFHDLGSAQGGPAVGGQPTEYGVSFVVGGWLGGEAPALVPSTGEPPTREKAFGEAGEVLLTTELDLSASRTTYAGSASSSGGLTLEGGFDYFVGAHVSFGVGASASYGTTTAPDATSNTTVTSTSTRFSLAPRVGYDIPLSSAISIYPRLSLGYAAGSIDERSGASADTYSDDAIYFALSVPLLVHPASHVVVGFGPQISHDLEHSYSFPNGYASQNRATNVGAGVTLGGWL